MRKFKLNLELFLSQPSFIKSRISQKNVPVDNFMVKQVIKVPSGIQFLSELEGFELPNGVLNKELTGCGATTIALTDKHPTIICSPRNELIKNKAAQFPDSFLVTAGVYPEDIKKYLEKTTIPKILISYDSFPKILEVIEDKQNWRIVVDEFHYILSDASFKSEVSLRLLNDIRQFPYVTYLSATPILDEFLSDLDYFRDIPYWQMDWQDKERIDLVRIKTNRPLSCIMDIVEQYKKGNYPELQLDNGNLIESKECVVFLNSVTDIANIIKHCDIAANEVNIIVANTEDNKTLISRIGREFTRGYIPLKGEVHKKFTFCTSTAYAGCDFYSECASTFVVSNCRKLNTSIDISTDLIQIAGRQRLESNPFRKKLYFIFNTDIQEVISDNSFKQNIDDKINMTNEEVSLYNSRGENFKKIQGIRNKRVPYSFKYDYSYTMYDENKNEFIFNKLAQLNEIYTYNLQKHNYKNGIIVKRQLQESGFNTTQPENWKKYEEQIKQIIKKEPFAEKMQEYCELKRNKDLASKSICMVKEKINPELKFYYLELGSDRIKALGYKEANLKREIHNNNLHNQIKNRLQSILEKDNIVPARRAKLILEEIYRELDIHKAAKGSDLRMWYDLEEKNIRIEGVKTKVFIIKNVKAEEGSNP